MSSFIERLQCYMHKKGINDNQLTVNAGLSVGLIGKTKQGMNSKNIEKILLAYPDINAEWLLTGKGEMLRSNNIPVARKSKNRQEGIPLIPFSAMAGALTSEQTALKHECEHYIIPAFADADFLITVKGNSMQPTYISGDIIACKKVPLNNIFFQWNKPYVLDTAQGPLIKRIKPAQDQQHITLISDNTAFDPIELLITDINAIALIVGLIRIE